MKTVKLDKWPSAQMQPMNDKARATMERFFRLPENVLKPTDGPYKYERPGLPDSFWKAIKQ